MTLSDQFVATLEKAGYAIAEADKPKIFAFIESTDAAIVNQAIAIVNKNFPRSSVEERMAEGPLLGFLKSAAPDITNDIDSGLEGFFTQFESTLNHNAA
jgi:hypothetical protein